MIDWIKDYIGLKNVVILITVVFVIGGLIFGPSLYKKVTGIKYEGIAKATVTNIVAKKSVAQHINGTNELLTGYDITYVYNNQNKKYSNTEFVKPEENIKRLFDKIASGETCFIEVKYALDNPSESMISNLNLNK
ncbi:MAG: hypothetical protein NTU98_13640 [Bacteroidetes bacterium]|nr:hypothetical protein [Bacteroidota bacterium]